MRTALTNSQKRIIPDRITRCPDSRLKILAYLYTCMKVISVISQKGGSGKTTLVVSLAVAADRDGKVAAVIDLDPQASAIAWSNRRDTDPVVVSSAPSRLESVLSTAREGGAEVVIIDTAPRVEYTARAAAEAADLVVVPCKPAILDLETVATTAELVRSAGDRRMVVVLNMVASRGTRHDQAAEILEESGIPVCPAAFGNRVAFDYAFTVGQTVQEFEPRGKAANEVKQVYTYISKHL